MPKITDAATLLIKLKESGTGEGKLDLIRDLLTANPEATAEEAIDVLNSAHHVTQRTVEKAMQLAEHGEVLPVQEVKVLSVEERILERRKLAAVAGQKQEALDKLAAEKLAAEKLAAEKLAAEKLASEQQQQDSPVPPPVQIGATTPEAVTSQSSTAGPSKVETVREPAKNKKG